MSAAPFKPYPLGSPIPDSPHAVCSSLPTLDDVIGYEEKRPEVMAELRQGYPRFLRHHWVSRLAEEAGKRVAMEEGMLVPICSAKAAERLCNYLGEEVLVHEDDGVSFAYLPDTPENESGAHAFLQHTGHLVSSREAEDTLVRWGVLEKTFEEETLTQDPEAFIEADLRSLAPEAETFWLTRSGMSAGLAALRGAAEVQARRGRTVWVQLGWLYLDTQRILEHLLPEGCSCVKVLNVFDLPALEKKLESLGELFAGVVTEVPTNPLVQSADIAELASSVRRRGGLTVFDPTLISLANINTFPYADIQVLSLTKYTSWKADVLCGALMINRECLEREELEAAIAPYIEPPYVRELQRLAWQMQDWRSQVDKMNANTLQLARWLEAHPRVRTVYWAYDAGSGPNTRKLTQSEEKPGAMLTLELNKPCADFYDASKLAKGPSFGAQFTMMCPFMYLAHYDMVSTGKGRALLRARGIDPELIRVSCGTEHFGAIREEFSRLLR